MRVAMIFHLELKPICRKPDPNFSNFHFSCTKNVWAIMFMSLQRPVTSCPLLRIRHRPATLVLPAEAVSSWAVQQLGLFARPNTLHHYFIEIILEIRTWMGDWAVTAWVMGAVAGQLVVVVGRVVGLALGQEIEAVAGRAVGVAEAGGLGVALAVGAHPASCACNHFWQVLNQAVAQILEYYYYHYTL
jgi:hypothetical protein